MKFFLTPQADIALETLDNCVNFGYNNPGIEIVPFYLHRRQFGCTEPFGFTALSEPGTLSSTDERYKERVDFALRAARNIPTTPEHFASLLNELAISHQRMCYEFDLTENNLLVRRVSRHYPHAEPHVTIFSSEQSGEAIRAYEQFLQNTEGIEGLVNKAKYLALQMQRAGF
jgi:hypothetical protein